MIDIKITIKEEAAQTVLNIVSPNFEFDFNYSTREEAALSALKFLHDFGVLQQFTDEEQEKMRVSCEPIVVKMTAEEAARATRSAEPVPRVPAPAAVTTKSAPGDGYIDIKQTAAELELAVASIYNFISQGIFPAPEEKYKGKNYWLKTTIAEFKGRKPKPRKRKAEVVEAVGEPEEEEEEIEMPEEVPEILAPEDEDEMVEDLTAELKSFIRTL